MCLKSFVFWLLALAFWLSASLPVGAQETPPSATFAQRLTQLRSISAQASALAQTLQLRLGDSRAQIETLQTKLRETQDELEQFKADLETQSAKAELSAQESQTLKKTAADLSDSLARSTQDFETYKTAAESKIRELAAQNWLYAGGGAAGATAVWFVLHWVGVIR